MNVEITDVRVVPVRDEKLKAYVSIVFDGCFLVNDLKVIQGKEGLFVSMPSRKLRNGEFKDVAHPLNQRTRDWLEARVLEAYRSTVDGAGVDAKVEALGDRQSGSGAAPASTLEEVERKHLDDAFWGVR